MYNDVQPFDSNPLYSGYFPQGMNYGHPLINLAMNMRFGQNYMPSSVGGQSMHDAMLQRNRTTEFMNLQRSGLMNNSMVQRVGLGANPMVGLMSKLASPDSAISRMMSPFVGGNPMAAQMQLYAGLAGGGVMGNFGRMSAVSAGETENVMQAFENKFYKRQAYEGAGGVREEINQQGKEALRNIAKGPDANKIFQDLGFRGVSVDSSGNFNAAGQELLKNFNLADDSPLTQKMDNQALAKKAQTSSFTAELDSILKQEGGKIDKSLRDKLLAKVKDTLTLTDAEMKKFKDEKGQLDVSAFKSEIDKMEQVSPFSKLRDTAKEAKRLGGVTRGFDFVNSRGFKIEDLTSGFVKAADLRMLGDQKNRSVTASAGDFAANAGGALSAARAVFGNLSGAELVGKISNIAGPEADLGSAEGASKVENLLRKVNATARVAGISIKTMLSIIDAGKQLAANHPALQSTSSAAITELAMRAVGTSVSLGATMSAADYRKAGGAQGIASQEIKTANEFAAGPVGATVAAAYFGATAEEKKQLDALLKDKPVTGRTLDEGLRAQMAKIRGMNAGELHRLATDNPELVAEALKDTETANKVYGAAKPAFTSAVLETLDRRGLSTRKLEELYKSSGGDFSVVESQIRRKLVTPQERRTFDLAKAGIQEKLIDSTRTKEERQAIATFDEIRNQSAADEKAMDVKYAGRYAPILTQAVDVLSSGISPSDMPGALASIFVTNNADTQKAKTAIENARKAGEKITAAGSLRGYTDEQKINQGGMLAGVNQFVKARIDKALEPGGDAASALDLGEVTEQDLTTTSKMAGSMKIKNVDEAERELAQLEKLSAENNGFNLPQFAGAKDRLTTLQTWKKLGILKDERALGIAQRGGASAQGAAAIQAAAGAEYKKAQEAEKSEITGNLGKNLDLLEKAGGMEGWDAQYLKNYYTTSSGAVDHAKMLRDKSKGTGAFSAEGWKDDPSHWERGRVGTMLTGAQDAMNRAEQRQGVLTDTSPELKSREDLTKTMELLVESLGSNGSLGGMLKGLIDAINSKF